MFINTKTIIFLLLFLAVTCLGIYVISNKAENPKEVTVKFFGVINEKNMEAVKSFLTNEPDYVRKKAFFTEKHENVSEAAIGSTEVSRETSLKLSSEELLKSVVPNLFFSQNRFLSDIVSIKEKGQESKVRVKVGSAELADIQYDILLFKDHNEWKVFAIRNVKISDTDDPYNFYAESQ